MIPWIEVQKVQNRRQEIGQRLLSNKECMALEAAFTKQAQVDQSGRSRLAQNKDSVGSNPSLGNEVSFGDVKMGIVESDSKNEQVAETAPGPSDNNRFAASPSNPMIITDLLTQKEYRIVAVGEPESLNAENAPKHLAFLATKTLKSLNDKHQNDYFWGELTPKTRDILKAQEIRNLNDLKAKVDRLDKATTVSLLEIIKLLVSIKK